MAAADYSVVITHDWALHETADAHLTFDARVDFAGAGEWRCTWPTSHSGALDAVDAVAGGEKPRAWGVRLRAKTPGAESFGFIAKRVGIIDAGVDGDQDVVAMEGYADDGVLAGMYGLPDPAVAESSTLGGWSVYADGPWPTPERAILDVVRDNLGSTALAARRLQALTVPAATGVGPVTSFDLPRRFPTLLEWVRSVCLLAGLTARVVRTGTGLRLVVRAQQVRPDVRWSRVAGTATGVALWWEDSPDGVLVGGRRTDSDDELTRQFRYVPNPVGTPPADFPWRLFHDDSGAEGAEELLASGLDRLTDETGAPSAVVVVDPEGTEAPLLGVDYSLGDLTPVQVAGLRTGPKGVNLRVESATITHEQSGAWLVTPTIGLPTGDPYAVAERLHRDVRRRGTV